jgi:linoleate 10R-lipoxygenase
MTSRYGKDVTPRGTGNQVSAEFNLAYRFHSCVGEEDEKWTETILQDILGKSPHDVSFEELLMGLGKFEHAFSKDPQKRPFAHLKRGPDGKFNDDDLARIMTMGIEQVAGSFGARNIPKSMRAITMLGIMQSRSWNLCTLNEYRHFFGLKKYETFEEINSDPQIANQLKHLYEHPDHIEIYPGLAVEDFKDPMVPGVGICPNYTISRVILSDAVTLIRGDRFYTLDWNPGSMTNWGFNEIAYDMNISRGAVFYKLMLRTLPRHFKPDSIYAHCKSIPQPLLLIFSLILVLNEPSRSYDNSK